MRALPKESLMQAGVSLGVVIAAILFILTISMAIIGGFDRKLSALKARKESAAALAVRLDTLRNGVSEKLIAIGAGPGDLGTLADPEAAKALITKTCAALHAAMASTCVYEEIPLTAMITLYQARLSASGALPDMISSMNDIARPPLRYSMVAIAPTAGGSAAVSALIEIIGVGSVQP